MPRFGFTKRDGPNSTQCRHSVAASSMISGGQVESRSRSAQGADLFAELLHEPTVRTPQARFSAQGFCTQTCNPCWGTTCSTSVEAVFAFTSQITICDPAPFGLNQSRKIFGSGLQYLTNALVCAVKLVVSRMQRLVETIRRIRSRSWLIAWGGAFIRRLRPHRTCNNDQKGPIQYSNQNCSCIQRHFPV